MTWCNTRCSLVPDLCLELALLVSEVNVTEVVGEAIEEKFAGS